jgi:Activator of Hsp90 ATPase homolog 1-like protein
VTHFSPLSGQEDVPENYHTVSYDLRERDGVTHVMLRQDNNATAEEAEHSAKNWEMMLDGLRRHVESR